MNKLFRSSSILGILSLALICFSCSSKLKKSEPDGKAQLLKYTVTSDNHPMALWSKESSDPKGVILFVHGRTWSGLPDFDLQVEGEELSLMDGMNSQGYITYAIDLRGYGETPRDSSEWNNPNKAATDIVNVINWIWEKENRKIHLFGWSMGSTLSLLATQLESKNMASLTMFGFWKDMDVVIPEDSSSIQLLKIINTAEAAASDFIVPSSISDKAVDAYVKMSLKADPNEQPLSRADGVSNLPIL